MTAGATCTVVIPAYNAADFIADAIESVLAQHDRARPPVIPTPIIVVDDGSADATTEVVQRYPGVTLIRQANAGPSAARNTGLAAVDTEYVIFLDADDTLCPGAIASHAAAMRAHPDAAMVFGANNIVDRSGTLLSTNAIQPFETRDLEFLATRVTPCGSQCMFRVEHLRAVGGYDAALRAAEDVDLILRLADRGSIAAHDRLVMNYRLHPAQATRQPSRNARLHLDVLARQFGPGAPHADPAAWHRIGARWKRYYGQFILPEIARQLLRGRIGPALRAARTFAAHMPASGRGAVSFMAGRLARRRKT